MGGGDVGSFRDVHVDDLAVLVDGAVHVASDAGDFDVGLVDEPAVTDRVAVGPGGGDARGSEVLDPSVDGDVGSTSMPRSARRSSTSRSESP